MSRFLVIGGAHVDRRGTIEGKVHLRASNPGRWRTQAGGGCLNAAAALCRLGHKVRLVAPRGGDAFADIVEKAATAAGIVDRPITFLDRATPTYTAILDEAGDLVVALADMALYDVFSPRQFDRRSMREAIASADMIVTDANLSTATLAALFKRAKEAAKPVVVIAISPAKVERLGPSLGALALLFMNMREATVLAGTPAADRRDWPNLLRRAGLRAGVVTDGASALIGFDETGEWLLRPPMAERVVDVTGAGDALAGATLAALAAGISLPQALRHGAAAAALTVASPDCAPEGLTWPAIEAALPLVPEPEPLHRALETSSRTDDAP
jgi:sugar/nucleoside kinase (ribokinase family)